MITQTQRVLEYLEAGKALTPLDAWRELGVYRLSSCIHDLRKDGHVIENKRTKVYNRFGEACSVARYRLVKEPGLLL